jgi:hypothetical protein
MTTGNTVNQTQHLAARTQSPVTALFRWSTATMGPFLPRLVLFTGTFPALSSSTGYDTMPAFIVPAAAQPVGFRSRAHG